MEIILEKQNLTAGKSIWSPLILQAKINEAYFIK